MKTVRHLLAPVLLALALASPASASDKTVPESDFNAYKDLAQVKLDAAKESLQKDVTALGTRVDNQDKRIDQQGNRIGDINIWLTSFSIFVSVAAIAFGLFGYVTVKNRTKEEAQKEARKATADWLATEGAELLRRVGDSEQATQLAQEMIVTLKAGQERLKAEADKAIRLIEEQMGKPDSTAAPIPADQLAALERSSAALNQKAESEYTFDDWRLRGYAAYGKGITTDAVELLRRAADMPDAPAGVAARDLFNTGVTLGKLGRTDEAIAAYDLVEARYAKDTAPALREQVAMALFNKGVALGQLGRTDEAIVAYGLVVGRYANDTAPTLREVAAKALFNNGVALWQLGRSDDEIAAFTLVEARYANDTAPALRKHVAYARNGKGFTLLCRAKANWAVLDRRHADLDLAARLFEQAEADIDDKPMVLGNRAYCAHLRGEPVEVVRPLLEQALKDRGEWLYKATLGDLAIHPVPEDAAFRVLLDEVWAELRGEDPPGAAPVAG